MKHKTWWICVVMVPMMLLVLFPIYWTISTALKPENEIVVTPVQYYPLHPTFENFLNAWNKIGFARYFRNSVIVSSLSVIGILSFALMAGYAVGRCRFVGKSIFMLILLGTQFVPQSMLLIPLSMIFKSTGLLNTHAALILCNITFQLPFTAVLISGFVKGVPYELEEAAQIDGCGRIRSIARVIIPLLLPGIVASSAFAFIGCWNEFTFSVMFINSGERFTLPIGLSYTQGQYGTRYGMLASGSIIALIPAILLFAYLQKYLITGLSAGAVKG